MAPVTGILQSVLLKDFKSYSGELVFGPLRRFSTICGPEHSGKSNLLDAIAFACGEQDAANLRASRLSDLICQHGNAVEASVKLVFAENQDENSHQRLFKRTITADGSSDYRVDGNVVNIERYLDELLRIHISIKSGHFRVCQEKIDIMAMMHDKARTAMFEMISRSDEMKVEYDLNKEEMIVDGAAFKFAQQKLNLVKLELQNANNKNIIYDFRRKHEETLSKLQVQYYAVKLYHCEREISNYETKVEMLECELNGVMNSKNRLEMEMKKALEKLNETKRKCAVLRKEYYLLMVQFKDLAPALFQARELVEYTKNNVSDLKKALKASETAHEDLLVKMSQFQTNLAVFQQKWNDLNDAATPGRLQLDAEQIREYNSLREDASIQTLVAESEKLSINFKVIEESPEFHKMRDLEAEIPYLEQELASAKSTHDKIEEFITVNTMLCGSRKKEITELLRNVKTAEHKLEEDEEEIDEIDIVLGQDNDAVAECERRDDLKAAIAKLKRHFSGVHVRVGDLYQPKSPHRYSIAISEGITEKMNCIIVVDSKNTAINCSQLVKQYNLRCKQFIALDSIDTAPFKKIRRDKLAQWYPGAVLLFDVLSFEPEFHKAIEFIANTVIVCETDSKDLLEADSFRDGQEIEAVLLNGFFFGKHGRIAKRASHDLTRQAVRLDEDLVNSLMNRKRELIARRLPMRRTAYKEAVIHELRMQCEVLEVKLKCASEEMAQQTEEIQVIQRKLTDEVATKEEMLLRVDELQLNVNRLATEINVHRRQIEELEDPLFADFCSRIGVANIRLYEQLGLESQKNRFSLQLIYEGRIRRLETQIELESSKNTLFRVQKLKDDVLTAEQMHNDAVVNLKVQEDATARLKWLDVDDVMGIYSAELIAIERSVHETNKKVLEGRQHVLNATVQHLDALTDCIALKSKRHALLKECKLANVALLFDRGSMDNLVDMVQLGFSGEENESVTSSAIYDHEADSIQINYNVLSDRQKELHTASQLEFEAGRILNEIGQLEAELSDKSGMIDGDSMAEMIEELQNRIVEAKELFANTQEGATAAKRRFEQTKDERILRFNELLYQVSRHADVIYKELTNGQNAKTWMWPKNGKEPYFDDVNYHCVSHDKGIQPISGLVNGERAMASLALLFSIRRYLKTPLFIPENIDTSLDERYVDNVGQFVRTEVGFGDMQCISISLKNNFYSQADATFGIGCEPAPSNVVKCISLELSEYDRLPEFLGLSQSASLPDSILSDPTLT